MSRPLTRSMIFAIALTQFPGASYASPNQESSTAEANQARDSLAKLAGRGEGKCQDGRTVVVVVLEANQGKVEGTVSIGNMHGDDVGAVHVSDGSSRAGTRTKDRRCCSRTRHRVVSWFATTRWKVRAIRAKRSSPGQSRTQAARQAGGERRGGGRRREEHPWQLLTLPGAKARGIVGSSSVASHRRSYRLSESV